MRINEILTEDQLDELSLKGLGQGLGRVPGAVAGGVVQGLKNVWNGAKQGYQAGQTALKPDANQSQGPSWAAPIPTGQGRPATAAPIAAAAAPTGGDNEVDQILQLVSKLNPDAKKDIVSKIQAEPAAQAEPATQPTQSADTQQAKPTTQAEPAAQAEPATQPTQPAKPTNTDQAQSAQTTQPAKPTATNYGGGQTQGAVPKVNYSFNANTKPATAPVKPAPEPEDDNPNIVRGYNEDVGYSRFLGMNL